MRKNSFEIDLSTDDWPFLYMPSKVYPITYLSIVIMLIISSALFLNKIVKINKVNFSFICFFLELVLCWLKQNVLQK